MCKRYIYLVLLVIYTCQICISQSMNSTKHNHFLEKDKEIKDGMNHIFDDSESYLEHKNVTNPYTKWSSWSRCINCVQRRMKKCKKPHCHDSRIYEERSCNKKRCKRKARQKKDFTIVHLDKDSSFLTKQGASYSWSKWSTWYPCSESCRTFRIRNCKKPGRCKKEQQLQSAYCYHQYSNCENYVLNLLDNRHTYDVEKYEYNKPNPTRKTSIKRRPKQCGRPFKKTNMLKIIGGTTSRKYKWPWHVAIINMYMEVFCGGTLIGPRWILTAAHCIRSYLRVRLNEHDLTATDGREIEMKVSKMFPHPKFNHKTVENDIALLLIPRAVTIPIACLPNKKPKTGQRCSVMGWGKIKSTDLYGISTLHEAKLPVVSSTTCKKSYRNFLISPSMFCAGYASGQADTCAGDSGGGILCGYKRTGKIIAYSVQGITSFGDGCGRKNKYGIYTMVYNYLPWINYVMDHYS